MPITINGIGTHYYGKKNLQARTGTCAQCGRAVQLTSYDTRLWFVVFFIPIIPLGRKRILDACPACRRHFAADTDKWEAAKQLDVSGALDRYRTAPTPEQAIAVHQTLLGYHQGAQAEQFEKEMIAKFPDNAKVSAYLGFAATQLGRLGEAERHFTRALELRPDLPEARIGVAEAGLRAGRLDEARKLLDFMEKPGAAQLYSLAPLERLAIALQNSGRHQEALDLFGVLLQALPAIGQHPGFRKTVRKSEKALLRPQSLLPKAKFSWRRLLGLDRTRPTVVVRGPRLTWRSLGVLGGLALLFVLVMVVANESIRRHRTLYVVSGFKASATMEIQGVRTMKIPPGVTEVVLPEGDYQVRISGPVQQQMRVQMRADYFDRWGDHPAWVLNVGGSALLLWAQTVYSKSPPPPSLRFYFGEPFLSLQQVTHPFRSLPESLHMKSYEERTLTHLDLFRGEPNQVVGYYIGQKRLPEAMTLAEWRLRLEPGDTEVLNQYYWLGYPTHQTERVAQFLHAGLTNRPVQTEWHRLYQTMRDTPLNNRLLVAEYETMLQAEPANSALIYLRGRVCTNHQEGRKWFERAIAAGPTNPYPQFALGFDEMAAGRWREARPFLERAVQLNPKEPYFPSLLAETMLALGDYAAAESEARRQAAARPFDVRAANLLSEALVAQQKSAEAEAAVGAFERKARQKAGKDADEAINLVRGHLLYALGDFAGLEKQVRQDRSPNGKALLFQALVEQGRAGEASKLLLADGEENAGPQECLVLAAAFRLAGSAAEAEKWKELAVQRLARGDPDHARCAALLRAAGPPSTEQLDEIVVTPQEKAILLAVLAGQHAGQRAELAAAARQLMIARRFPYHLIQRAAHE